MLLPAVYAVYATISFCRLNKIEVMLPSPKFDIQSLPYARLYKITVSIGSKKLSRTFPTRLHIAKSKKTIFASKSTTVVTLM